MRGGLALRRLGALRGSRPVCCRSPMRRRGALRGGRMMPADEDRARAAQEALFCEQVLAKGGDNVLHATLRDAPITAWTHYPPGDVYDPASGGQWYYHCHLPPAEGEHGHFHCFARPDGKDGPVHHLVAVGVDARGRLQRLFTVNHWVVGDTWLDAEASIPLLARFDIQMPQPSYLTNRWLTAILRLYEDDIASLIRGRDATLAAHRPPPGTEARADRALEVTSELRVDLLAKARELGL
jgi:hypothetical protein